MCPGARKEPEAAGAEPGEEAAAPPPSLDAAAAGLLLFPKAAAGEALGCPVAYVRRELEEARTRIQNAASAVTLWDQSAPAASGGVIDSTAINALLLDTEHALYVLRGDLGAAAGREEGGTDSDDVGAEASSSGEDGAFCSSDVK